MRPASRNPLFRSATWPVTYLDMPTQPLRCALSSVRIASAADRQSAWNCWERRGFFGEHRSPGVPGDAPKAGQKDCGCPDDRWHRAGLHAGRPGVVKALARAFRYQPMLDEGRHLFITEMAAAERLELGYPRSLLRLTLLAAAQVAALLDERHPGSMTLLRIMEPYFISWITRHSLGPREVILEPSAVTSSPPGTSCHSRAAPQKLTWSADAARRRIRHSEW